MTYNTHQHGRGQARGGHQGGRGQARGSGSFSNGNKKNNGVPATTSVAVNGGGGRGGGTQLTSTSSTISNTSVRGVTISEQTVTVSRQEPQKVEQRPSFDMLCVVDTSGSMSGPPIAAVKESLSELETFAESGDRMGLTTFDTSVTSRFPLTFKDLLRDRIAAWEPRTGSRTALHDAVVAGVQALHARPPRRDGKWTLHPYLIVLTDGVDNASRHSFEDMARLLSSPKDAGYGGPSMAHFHVIFVTVGRDASVAELRELCGRRPNLAHIHADDHSATQIRAAFHNVVRTVSGMMRVGVVRSEIDARGNRQTHTLHAEGAEQALVRAAQRLGLGPAAAQLGLSGGGGGNGNDNGGCGGGGSPRTPLLTLNKPVGGAFRGGSGGPAAFAAAAAAASNPLYKTQLCKHFPKGLCTKGAACQFAHGAHELRTNTFGR